MRCWASTTTEPWPENAERSSMAFPVTSFTVNPSRFTCAKETPRLTLSRDDRSRRPSPNGPRPVVAERCRERTRPLRQGRPGAGDVHQPSQRVPAEQRALRTAHELDLIDVEQLDARGVRVELRDAVDVGGDAGIVRAGADAPETGVAQLPRRPLREERIRGVDGRLADDVDAGILDRRPARRRSR